MTRTVFLLPAGVALLGGLNAALLLLGLPAPLTGERFPDVHGMALVLGFVGSLIALERAVALGRRLGYCAPLGLGLGTVLLFTPLPAVVGKVGLVLGAAALIAVYVPLWRRQRDDAVLVQAFGAVLATGAAVLWLGGVPMPVLLPWLTAFVVLTIGGERLELARLAMGPSAGSILVALSGGLSVAVVATLLWPAVGYPLLGVALLALAGWLARHDVARRTVRVKGVTRFMAASMLAGYAWLVVAGVIWLLGPSLEGSSYDAVIHAVFLGFTISMIMAHAPIILPAVLRRPLSYRPVMWVPAILLQAGLVVRIWLGDGLGLHAAWLVGGVANIVALLFFMGVAVWSVASVSRRGGTRSGRGTAQPRRGAGR